MLVIAQFSQSLKELAGAEAVEKPLFQTGEPEPILEESAFSYQQFVGGCVLKPRLKSRAVPLSTPAPLDLNAPPISQA